MPRIHTIEVARLTPLGQILAEYMRGQWPRLQTKAELAHHVGVRPSTIDNLMYSQHAPSSRTLNKIARATGIPAAVLYEAAAGQQPQAYVRPSSRRAAQPAQIAEQADPLAPLGDYVRRIKASGFPADLEKALIDTAVQAVTGYTPEQLRWQERYREEHDQDAISTMLMPAMPATPSAESRDTNPSQEESQPAESRS